jgi:hypothetical protein
MYCTLTQVYGYLPENIFVHALDGPNGELLQDITGVDYGFDLDNDADHNSDVDSDASYGSIHSTFNTLAQTLTDEDQLFVFVTDHGYIDEATQMSTICLWDNETDPFPSFVTAAGFDTWLDSIICSQKIVVMGQCYSGGFVNGNGNLSDSRVAVYSAVSGTELSWSECIFAFGELPTFYLFWISAARSQYPLFETLPEGTIVIPYTPGYTILDFPYEASYLPHYWGHEEDLPGEIPLDTNIDGYPQLNEIYTYSDRINYRTLRTNDQLDVWFTVGSDEAPPDPNETPQFSVHTGFQEGDAVLTLGGYCGTVSNTQTVTGTYLVCGDLIVSNGSTLTLGADGKFFLLDGAHIVVESGATLVLDSSSEIVGETGDCGVVVGLDGNIIIEDQVEISFPSTNRGFIEITRPSSHLNWSGITLNNCNVYISQAVVTIQNSFIPTEINNCKFDFNDCSVVFDGVQSIEGSYIMASTDNAVLGAQYSFHMTDCFLNDENTSPAVTLSNYDSFKFIDNTIQGFPRGGIHIYESALGEIRDNIIQDVSRQAILLYHTKANILNENVIESERVGIQASGKSTWIMKGHDYGPPFQRVIDCGADEIQFSYDSIPTVFQYNMVSDQQNLPYYLMNCTGGVASTQAPVIDVRLNNWGAGFDPATDFRPFRSYRYTPTWPAQALPDSPESLYLSANEAWNSGDYDTAESLFLSLLSQSQDTGYGFAAAKDLFQLEKNGDREFLALQSFYMNSPLFQVDSLYIALADYLVNACNLETGNYEEAVYRFEEIIDNPPSCYDSLCAMVDLGYTYSLMDGSSRSTFCGLHPEWKPTSIDAFHAERETIMDMLLGAMPSETHFPELSATTLLPNFPNPFNPTTTISFSLPKDGEVKLSIYNIKGQRVATLLNEPLTSGQHKAVWNGKNQDGHAVSSGVYFYRLDTGDKTVTKKMLLLK